MPCEPGDDLGVQPRGRLGAVDDEIARRSGSGKVEEVLADPVVELVVLAFEAVVDAAAALPTHLGGHVQNDGEVGEEPAHGPVEQPVDLVGAEVTPGPLVGDRRVGVTVGHDILATVERRPDEVVDMLGLVCGEEQRFGPRAHLTAVQQQVADLAAELGAAGLTGHDDTAAGGGQCRHEQPHLGGLAGPVAALEGDEQPTLGRRGAGWLGHEGSLGQRSDNAARLV